MDRYRRAILILAAGAVALGRCGPDEAGERRAASDAQEVFWSELSHLCNHAFAGRVTAAPPGDTVLSGKRLVMHVRECTAVETRIAFQVGEDRSRTWVLTRRDSSIRLRHEHRHRDGSASSATDYGGTTVTPGSATLQEFPADALTAAVNPRTRTNVWSIALDSSRFVYGLDRLGTDRRFRVEFDLMIDTVPAPPPPWGR